MASEVEICNRALQKLGAKRVTSLSEDSRNARSCNAAYVTLRDAELRRHPWSFAIKRVQLAESATSPPFGLTRAFPLPSDYLRLLNPDPNYNTNDIDWQIEADELLTTWSSPLDFRYIARITDPNLMDVLFREALSMRMAYELAEEITQSNPKKEEAYGIAYVNAIAEAKKANAIERTALIPPIDKWETARR